MVCNAVACGLGTGELQQGPSFFSFVSTCSLPLNWGSNCARSKGAYWSLWWKDQRPLLQLLKRGRLITGGSGGGPYPVNLPWSHVWLLMRPVMDWLLQDESWSSATSAGIIMWFTSHWLSPFLPRARCLATSAFWHAWPFTLKLASWSLQARKLPE